MRSRLIAFTLLCLLAVCAVRPTFAQQYSAEKPVGATAQKTPAYLKNAGIDQRLNSALPLNDHFRDESGHDVALAKFFGQRSVVMALVYFKCGMLCTEVLHGLAQVLPQTGFHAGHQYEVVVTSIDPSDTPTDAAQAKQHCLSMLAADAAGHVH